MMSEEQKEKDLKTSKLISEAYGEKAYQSELTLFWTWLRTGRKYGFPTVSSFLEHSSSTQIQWAAKTLVNFSGAWEQSKFPREFTVFSDSKLHEDASKLLSLTTLNFTELNIPDSKNQNAQTSTDASIAAIQFALQDEDGLTFLREWNEGEFDSIRENWPDAPKEVFMGADPLYKEDNNLGS